MTRSAVNGALTGKRPRQVVENSAFAAFARRIIRAYSRRISGGDIEALMDMAILATEAETALGEAVKGLHAYGYSWADIARPLGITRQAAQQRWGGDPQ
jgi:hypothetical protein